MKRLNRIILGGVLIVFVPVVAFIIAVGYFWYVDKYRAPVLFPLDDMKATYVIFKTIDHGITYYWLNYTGTRAMGSEGTKSTFSVMIGQSDEDLDQYANPYLTPKVLIKGTFGYSKRQCIQTRCVTISTANRNVVINIKQVIP